MIIDKDGSTDRIRVFIRDGESYEEALRRTAREAAKTLGMVIVDEVPEERFTDRLQKFIDRKTIEAVHGDGLTDPVPVDALFGLSGVNIRPPRPVALGIMDTQTSSLPPEPEPERDTSWFDDHIINNVLNPYGIGVPPEEEREPRPSTLKSTGHPRGKVPKSKTAGKW